MSSSSFLSKPNPKPNSQNSHPTPTDKKYCSSRCKSSKPNALDHSIEGAFVALLQGKKKWEDRDLVGLGVRSAALKGDPRVVVDCGVVEKLVFGARGEGEGEFSFPNFCHQVWLVLEVVGCD
jgi:hypothetical protein